jgi:hypothetical protein
VGERERFENGRVRVGVLEWIVSLVLWTKKEKTYLHLLTIVKILPVTYLYVFWKE